ncbi:MAG TPA: penicillin-binding protein 2 [Trebonia sp.]|jgi:penicillin-binding protein 2|nr:penicillin-binding protein 2 [Trebonia sp.]
MIPASRRRLAVLYLIVAAMIAALGGRLWYVQVMSGPQLKTLADANQTRDIVVPAVRGGIVDDQGKALVTNQTAMVVSVNMMQLAQTTPDDGKAVLKRLAPLLHTSYRTLSEKTRLCTKGVKPPCWSGSPYQPIPVAQDVGDQTALQIMEEPKQFPGITAQVQPVVDYPMPDGANPAQVLGYLQPITQREMAKEHLAETGFAGDDLVGQAGLEAEYNSALTGRPGKRTVSVNAGGDVTGTVGETPPKNGDTLVTSLNATLQSDVQSVLNNAITKARHAGNSVNQGAAIVETTSGRVVAMASYPGYNPNVWTNGISENEFRYLFGGSSGEPILNYATQGEYAPGSTFKVTSTAAAVADGYSLDGTYNCPSNVSIDGQNFNNDGEPPLGALSFEQALIVSCDTVYYGLAYQMWQADDNKADFQANPNAPVQKMQRMELAWGFGKDTGVDLPEESTGNIPTRQWLYYLWKDNAHAGQNWCKNGSEYGSYVQRIEWQDCKSGYTWEPGQAAIAAIGQGYVDVTPLQLANAYAALANGGTLYKPRIGEALIAPSGQVAAKISPPVARHLPVSSYTLSYIRNALHGVVSNGAGTGYAAFSGYPENNGNYCVAGKTGTSQSFGKNASSVFASFSPCQHPKYVVLVMIPSAGYGADAAAPAVKQIYDDLYGLQGHKAALPGGRFPALPKKVHQ